MVESIKIDKQGRFTIPAHIRNQFSISENSILEIEIQANQIIIRKQSAENPDQVEQWFEKINQIPLNSSTPHQKEEDSKWYSEEYVYQKLGL
jgi:AbrB family looped-hinge helix DNA binding protein